MKKYLIILMVAFAFSCSSDDSGKPASEKIIGTWQLVSITINDIPLALQDCEYSEKIIFSSNKSFDEEHFASSGQNSCTFYDDSFIGDWSNNGDKFAISSNPLESFAFFTEAEFIKTQFSNNDTTMNLLVNMAGETSASDEPYVINLLFEKVIDTPTSKP